MFNYKLNYIAVQAINIIFWLFSYYFVREHFLDDGSSKLESFVYLFPTVIAGIYVFFTNRVFYVTIKSDQNSIS